jgi:hypothetical protein
MPSMPVLALVMPAVSGCMAHELPCCLDFIQPRMKRSS